MARFLQLLLEANEPMFSKGISSLEKTTGNSCVDVRLIADITEKAHQIMRKLGLDVRDTTGRELYSALVATVKLGTCESLLSDVDYVLIMADGKIISFNLIDVIENAHHKLSYDKQTVSHGQRSLRGEILSRYLDHPRTNEPTTIDIAISIGLLADNDEWYNDIKHKLKPTITTRSH